jgi:type I restriction enzyme R subunit
VADSGIEPTSGLLEKDVRRAAAETLRHTVESMNLDNFVVRPKRRLVEKYAKRESWNVLPAESRSELAHYVAGLPTELDPENEEAKRFDLLLLKLQLAKLTQGHGFERMRDQVKDIAGMLEEKASIPMVSAQMPLILDIQTDHWWQDVTVGMLEAARRRLRELVQLIEKAKRKRLYSDFEDEMGAEMEFDLPGFKEANDLAKFRAKAQAFLRAHQSHVAINKLRMNKSLTATDLAELERMLLQSGIGGREDIERAVKEARGLGLFVRSLVGLDIGAAKQALGAFVTDSTLSANQIEFVSLIVDHLTEYGTMDPSRLYESPFTDLSSRGPDGLFSSAQLDQLVAALAGITRTAQVAA